jgi:uncharacterized protein YdeI (YjbR/CyaY-like superfamily)
MTTELEIRGFASAAAFATWLKKHHERHPGILLKIPKKGGTGTGPSYAEALETALRFGWIDSQKRSLDENHFLQRFTPRKPRSRWSKINRDKAEALIAAGDMAPAGLREVEAAQADGRWQAAYDSHRTARVPDDLRVALGASAKAQAFFEGLSAANRFAILHRIQDCKRPDTRARRIAKYVEMCARGETVY